jgi:hypothetical protein
VTNPYEPPRSEVEPEVTRPSTAPRPVAPPRPLISVIGLAIGLLVSRFGDRTALLVPGLSGLIAGLIAYKLVRPEARPMVPAFAVQAGHLVWLSIGLVVLRQLDLNVADVVILLGGITWLLAAPGLGPVLLLGGYQLLALGVNVWVLTSGESPGALAVHILLRMLAIAFMVDGLRRLQRT